MNKYSVYVSGRVSKIYEVEADSKEDAMVEALDFFNEFASENYTDTDVTSQIFTDAEDEDVFSTVVIGVALGSEAVLASYTSYL